MVKKAKAKAKTKKAVAVVRKKSKPPKRKPKERAVTDKETKADPKPVAPMVATTSVPPADMMTEQEKDTSGETKGVGPAAKSETTSGPVETIEDLGIGPREPYPEGSPPVANAATTRSENIKKGK